MQNNAQPANGLPPDEDIVRIDRRRLLQNVSLSMFGQAGAAVTGMFVMILTTRLLAPEGYGRLALFFMVLEMLSQLLNWPNIGLVRFGREEMRESGAIGGAFRARLALYAISLAVVAPLLYIFRVPLENYLALNAPAWLLLLLFLAFNEMVFLLRALMQTAGRFGPYALSLFGVRALNLVFIGSAFYLIKIEGSVARVIMAQTASLIMITIGSIIWIPWAAVSVSAAKRVIGRMARYSWPVMFSGFSVLVVSWVDLVVLKHFFPGGDEVGLYAAAYQAITVLNGLRIAFVNAFLPLIVSLAVQREHEALQAYVDEIIPQSAWLIGAGCLIVAAGAEAIPFVLGAEYAPSVRPCQILIAGLGFSALASFQGVLLKAMDHVGATVIATTLLAGLNVIFDIALVPIYGMLGAAVATVTAFVLSGLLYFPAVNAVVQIRGTAPYRRYIALVGLVPPLLFSVAAATLGTPGWRLAAAGILLVAWFIAVRATGLFRVESLERAQAIQMPRWFRHALTRLYAALEH